MIEKYDSISKKSINVDVLVSTFNNENTIEKCIESILQQDHNSWRLIIFNDNSQDETFKKIISYQDQRIILINSKKNVGTYQSKNFLMRKLAKGKYIALHDADDYSHPFRLGKQINYLEENLDCVCVGSAVEQEINNNLVLNNHNPIIRSNGSNFYPKRHSILLAKKIFNYLSKPKLYNEFLSLKICMNGSIMIRKDILDDLGGWDPRSRVGGDTEIYSRLVSKGYVDNLQEVLYTRTIHNDSLTQSKKFGSQSEFRKKYNLSTTKSLQKTLDGNPMIYSYETPDLNENDVLIYRGGELISLS